jgi:hypothetical protein
MLGLSAYLNSKLLGWKQVKLMLSGSSILLNLGILSYYYAFDTFKHEFKLKIKNVKNTLIHRIHKLLDQLGSSV